MRVMEFLFGPVLVAWRNRLLLRRLGGREIAAKTRSTLLGGFWLVMAPLFMLSVYSFVFTQIFSARWGSSGSGADAPLMIFAGMIVLGIFAECLARAPGLVLENPTYVKKVVFPLEILPWSALAGASVAVGVGLVLLLLAQIVLHGPPPVTALLLPLPFLPLALFILGFSWFLASLGVFLRDLKQAMGIVVSALTFAAPVFYPIEAVPESFRSWLYLNPVTLGVEELREILFNGTVPDALSWLAYLGLGWVTAMVGLWWFRRTRKGFADVL
ncbi:MAG: lipopolysaccharide transport system permease protein [Aliidongia sp.]|jgi:lipopolysaccharide transport system permease protein|nr:lipopolysaccharide transport system permease protein [Aliidongia sp.]